MIINKDTGNIFYDENLITFKNGHRKGCIDWKGSINKIINVLYNKQLYCFTIIDYETKGNKLFLKTEEDKIFSINISSIKKSKIGRIIGNITDEFKVDIGDKFKDYKRDLTIVDREYREYKGQHLKYYKYKCNKCGNEDWMVETFLLSRKSGCNCCLSRKVVPNINSIKVKSPWMIDLGVSEEDSINYTPQSSELIEITCPDCGKKSKKRINNIYKYKSIACSCGDGQSYISKYIMSALDQLNIKYDTEVKYEWNKYVNPLTNKESQASIDFVLYHNNREIPLEADGAFHRKDNGMNGQTKEMSEYIDKQRDNNCLKYLKEETIRISDKGDIKENILNSKLNDIFDLSQINWNKCEEFALKNIVKEVCEYWNQKEEWETTVTIADNNEWGIKSSPTIIRYLKKGAELGWCNYNAKEEKVKSAKKTTKYKYKPVEIFKDGISLGVFESAKYLEEVSLELFGVKLNRKNISQVCLGQKQIHKGYTFKFTRL